MSSAQYQRPRWNPQQPTTMPTSRYRPPVTAPPGDYRHWPNRRIEHAPLWVPVDLRDGNQALVEPMDPARKQRFFDLLVQIGFKEIEVGYPAASETDFAFVRQLIESRTVPDDVTLVVLTPARTDLIARTFEAIEGATNVMVHLYNATAPLWRQVVFEMDVEEVVGLASRATLEIARQAHARANRQQQAARVTARQLQRFEAADREDVALPAGVDPLIHAAAREGVRSEAEVLREQLREFERACPVRLEYSPEAFSLTESEVALRVCQAVVAAWEPTAEHPLVINLPATVEAAAPNVYADQIEYMDRRLQPRNAIILSAHTHNDRGEAVAASELALLAGAQRVEGCLFGNGERTGNACLITLALNLYSQGIDPELDLHDIDAIRDTVEYCNRQPVHPRHPYAGELVYTSFSGTHQDAINKGFAARQQAAEAVGMSARQTYWEMPYLPLDPQDVGRSYEAVVRVNSQSGKGGVAYIMAADFGLELPRALQIELARSVQARAEASGGEISSETLWDIFAHEYMPRDGALAVTSSHVEQTSSGEYQVSLELGQAGVPGHLQPQGRGAGPLEAFVAALGAGGYELGIEDYHEHAMGAGADARAAAYVCLRRGADTAWGVGVDPSIVAASFAAVIAALNRLS